MKNDRPPDYVNRIAGVRSWRVAPTLWAKMGGLLWSHAMLNPWPNAKEMLARCDVGHEAPARGCMCGVWAWLDAGALSHRVSSLTSASEHATQ